MIDEHNREAESTQAHLTVHLRPPLQMPSQTFSGRNRFWSWLALYRTGTGSLASRAACARAQLQAMAEVDGEGRRRALADVARAVPTGGLETGGGACEGTTGGGDAGRASNGDADGCGSAPDRDTACAACSAPNNTPPTGTESGVGEVEVADISKSVVDFASDSSQSGSTRHPALELMAGFGSHSWAGR